MKNLRRNFERFCYTHRNIGIPNLMLYITIGSALVYVMSMFKGTYTLYEILCFNRAAILQGQVWRLFTYVFTYNAGSVFLTALSLFCYFSLGRSMENSWGTLRFNLFYFTGMILMDIFAMLCPDGYADVTYLNLSLFLGFATMYPDARFMLFFFIPVRAWIFALINLGLTVYQVVMLTLAGRIPYNFFPLVAIANYFLFFGPDVVNVLPMSWRAKLQRKRSARPEPKPKATGTIPFRPTPSKAPEKTLYTHRCTICGRTDVSNPELEFRYCSRCNGYHCYCEEHISNHEHIE